MIHKGEEWSRPAQLGKHWVRFWPSDMIFLSTETHREGLSMWQLSQQSCRHSYLCKRAKCLWPYQWEWILLTDKQSSGQGPRRKICEKQTHRFCWWRMQSLWDLCHRNVFYPLRDNAQDEELNNAQDIEGSSWTLALYRTATITRLFDHVT